MPDPDTTPEPTPSNPEPQSVAVSTPQTTAAAEPQTSPDPQTPSTPPSVDFTSVIPDAYKDKPYMKEVDSFDKLFADFDNAQSLIGQRQDGNVLPGKDATPEQIDAFLKKVQPESIDAYTLPETEFSKKFGRNEEFGNQMKELFREAGLEQWQIDKLATGYDAAAFAVQQQQAGSDEQIAADFEKMADGHFGEQKQAKLEIANKILKANTPEAFQPFLEKLPNESLMVLSAVLNNVHDKFMKEDDLNIGAKGTSSDGAAIQEEARQLMASPAYKDFRHPDHDRTVKRVNELYDQVGKIKN